MKEVYVNPEMTVTQFTEVDIVRCSDGDTGDIFAEESTTAEWVPMENPTYGNVWEVLP